ncbi:hypothetical protein [Exiguobacterium sp. UBA5002]|uniref:hypothetical protein n=1 Tax=Exiguobacterium sp. UBA5002 TaxID=1946497 RepID=UPI0025BC4CA8|nr:hypothetical protein [Exiguobacterium sp. UBA5002]
MNTIYSDQQLKEHILAALNGNITHEELADWCYRYMIDVYHNDYYHLATDGRGTYPLSEQATEVANDIDAQWDMYLANSYTLNELQTIDLATIHLPREWLEKWLQSF